MKTVARHRPACLVALGLAALSLSLAACSSSPSNSSSSGSKKLQGGTVYLAEAANGQPDYIFPLEPFQDTTIANIQDFQALMYRPLYWFGSSGVAQIDYADSIGNAPTYSDGNRVVTVTLKHYVWSDGETVSSRDVLFWMNLLFAEKDNWSAYVPGAFPDNVASVTAPNATTVVFHLKRSYDPVWFTYNELSEITPLPIAWDRTSLSQPIPAPTANNLPDTTTAGAKAVYNFLAGQAKELTSYATSPIWGVVDGPFKLVSFTTTGEVTMAANKSYAGPVKPTISELVELPFTSASSEYDVVKSGSATGGPGTSGAQISIGYLPLADLPQRSSLVSQGYATEATYPFEFGYGDLNLANPTVGAIFRELYFRQAFQHLIDQPGWIKAFFDGLAVPTYGAVPILPQNSFADSYEKANPYPFDVSAAAKLLQEHGWDVKAGGTTTCAQPGTGPSDCGAGISAGEALSFTLDYASGDPTLNSAMSNLASTAAGVGIQISLQAMPFNELVGDTPPCSSSQAICKWQMAASLQGWFYAPDFYPTGEVAFESGSFANTSNYSNTSTDDLIKLTQVTSAANAQHALDEYQDNVARELPVFWLPLSGTMVVLQKNLRGYVPNPYEFIEPEDWYFVGK